MATPEGDRPLPSEPVLSDKALFFKSLRLEGGQVFGPTAFRVVPEKTLAEPPTRP
jgi:hypothetical protein